jgi:hypothetical protein
MHESVEMSGALLYLLTHFIVHFHVEDICYKVESVLVVLHFRVESSQIESVRKVVFVDFAEVFVAAG